MDDYPAQFGVTPQLEAGGISAYSSYKLFMGQKAKWKELSLQERLAWIGGGHAAATSALVNREKEIQEEVHTDQLMPGVWQGYLKEIGNCIIVILPEESE